MQYPQFQRDGWPIGSGMVESANKNVVEARLKGTGMHWERKNVNPMLALRNAVCNGRWREMWRKAVVQYRKQHALQRSARAEQQSQVLLAGSHSALGESFPPSVAAFQPLSPPVPAQPAVAAAEGSPIPSPSRVSVATRPRSCRPSSPRKKHTAHNRVKYSRHRSGDGETCVCGTPLVQVIGGRTRQYCSDACRQRAYRERQAEAS